MRKCLVMASAVLALAPVVFFNSAFADDRHVKRTKDFAPMLNGPSDSLGKTGVVVKIQNAAIAKDGTITVRATIVDSNGNPLDRLGVQTPGAVSMSFICARIPAGQTQYVSYTTSVAAATITNNPSQTQAANDSGGTFAANALGDYTYTFKTKAPANFDATVTHAVGVSAQRNLAAYGTFDEWSETANDVFTFVPNGSKVSVTRSVVNTSACNQCHDPLIGHGGSRLEVELCIMCHTPQTGFARLVYIGSLMTVAAGDRIRCALVLLLLCAVTIGQSAALTATHEQHRAHDHGCLVCQVGSMPFLESPATAPLAPILLIRWLESVPDFEAAHDARPAARSSRAPPA